MYDLATVSNSMSALWRITGHNLDGECFQHSFYVDAADLVD